MGKNMTGEEARRILAEMDRIAEKSKLTEKGVKELAEKVEAGAERRFREYFGYLKQKE